VCVQSGEPNRVTHNSLADHHTPEVIHLGHAPDLHTDHTQALSSAYDLHPERFVWQVPKPPALPTTIWINPPTPSKETEVAHEYRRFRVSFL